MDIRTITKEEENGTQFCNRNRATEYCKSKNKFNTKHRVFKSRTYRNDKPVYCWIIQMI